MAHSRWEMLGPSSLNQAQTRHSSASARQEVFFPFVGDVRRISELQYVATRSNGTMSAISADTDAWQKVLQYVLWAQREACVS